MNGRSRTVVAAGVACVAVALPAAAQAKTKTVAMGLPSSKVQKQFQKLGTEVNDFFPHGVTIHAGDKVKFVPTGFHTVDLPKKAGRVLPFITPSAETASGFNDAAGQPFWFNGQPKLQFNRLLLKSGFGKHFTYTGKKAVRSGVALGPAKPFTVRFKKAGRYTYFCNIHPGMKGTVRVRPASKKVPSGKADQRRLRNQIERDLGIAKSLARTKVPAKTVDVGSAGPHGVEFYGMFPLKPLTVHVGESVLFRMTKGSFEDHTATFAQGGGAQKKGSFLNDLAKTFEGPGPFDPRATYSSEAPGSSATLTTTTHGNGFWNSGVMDRSNATPQLPGSNSVTFEQAGTYKFYCLIHPFMRGTVRVLP